MTDSTPDITRSASWLASLRAGIVLIILCGGIYPFAVTSLGGLLFPHQATGSLITIDGNVVGSELVGQRFDAPGYFHGRPSAANHDPFVVSGSNYAASNPELRERVRQTSQLIADRDNIAPEAIPVDLLAASGSGIDPHISPDAARIQAARIASARGIPAEQVNELIQRYTQAPTLGVLGQPRVNVLRLNLALDGKERSD
ncbi:potassium-transporting ATPase subunit KdpC [Halomonas sp. TBZ9]|uniref:Potassium-transporting ATPase KdpC subunit n=1 Tax=Vreelandella azerica TaxID=2732867 RepID=A0A7Y3XBM5_9GAMM|nr:potassium-transporting ATPase subunit KdpC [Halomonas azerica]NOG32488.1 potassium-transporting ATPase subunit KdpC [Halomonas azerica]